MPVPRSFPQSHQRSPRERQEIQGAAEMKTVMDSELIAMTTASKVGPEDIRLGFVRFCKNVLCSVKLQFLDKQRISICPVQYWGHAYMK